MIAGFDTHPSATPLRLVRINKPEAEAGFNQSRALIEVCRREPELVHSVVCSSSSWGSMTPEQQNRKRIEPESGNAGQ
jgi:hypothetical protein